MRLEPRHGDNAPRSILELIDGNRDMKFALAARTVARLEAQGLPIDPKTSKTVRAIYRYRKNGEEEFRKEVEFMRERFYSTEESISNVPTTKEPRKKAPLEFATNPLLAKKKAEAIASSESSS